METELSTWLGHACTTDSRQVLRNELAIELRKPAVVSLDSSCTRHLSKSGTAGEDSPARVWEWR